MDYNIQEIFNAAINHHTGNLSNAARTFHSKDDLIVLECCCRKIFNENLFIKSGDVVSFVSEVACNCDLDCK